MGRGGLRFLIAMATAVAGLGCGRKAEDAAKDHAAAKEDPRPVVVTASVDRAKVDVGENVKYTVQVRAKAGYKLDLPLCLDNVPVFVENGRWETRRRED